MLDATTADKEEEGMVRKKREEYIKEHIFGALPTSFKPPKKGDKLCGLEFTVTGPCAFIYLNSEEGVQKWRDQDDNDQLFVVKVANDAFQTPKKIHRQDFYKKNTPRRTWLPPLIKDNSLKINRESTRNNLVSQIKEKLDELFKINVDTEIV